MDKLMAHRPIQGHIDLLIDLWIMIDLLVVMIIHVII